MCLIYGISTVSKLFNARFSRFHKQYSNRHRSDLHQSLNKGDGVTAGDVPFVGRFDPRYEEATGIFFATNGRATRSTIRKYLSDFKLNNIFVPINHYNFLIALLSLSHIRFDISIVLLNISVLKFFKDICKTTKHFLDLPI